MPCLLVPVAQLAVNCRKLAPKLLGSGSKPKVGLVPPLIENAADFGACAATLGLVRTFQVASCDHLKKIKRVNHIFPDIDDVQKSKDDNIFKNVVNCFLKRFWMDCRGYPSGILFLSMVSLALYLLFVLSLILVLMLCCSCDLMSHLRPLSLAVLTRMGHLLLARLLLQRRL